ncbi:FecR domain-containing protein [Candidatus Sumerlaeota bacterium]|nr:FecR domain-containing protein [Candidatus Sumerlaeota bacterium]
MKPEDLERLTSERDDVSPQDAAALSSAAHLSKDEAIRALSAHWNAYEERRLDQLDAQTDRLVDYVIHKVRIDAFRDDASHEQDKQDEGFKDRFWSWVISRFRMLPASDDAVFGRQIPLELKPVFGTLLAASIVFVLSLALIVMLWNTGQPAQITLPAKQVYPKIATQDTPRIVAFNQTVQLAMAAHSDVQKINESKIQFNRGKVWLDVEKGGEGFEVVSDWGLVHVTGTSFGVTHLDEGIRVDVAEGSVDVEDFSIMRSITAGQFIIISDSGLGPAQSRSEGQEKAFWVRNLDEDRWIGQVPGLLAYWPMETELDENGRLVLIDRGPYQLHGYEEGGQSLQPGVESISNVLFGSCVEFDPQDPAWFRITQPYPLNEMKDNFTVMAWVKLNNANSYNRILASYNLKYGIHFGFHETLADFCYGDGGGGLDTGGLTDDIEVPLDDSITGHWLHYTVTFSNNGRDVRQYINGKLMQSAAVPFSHSIKADVDWFIGRNRMPGDENIEHFPFYFNGKIDDLRVYSRPLSQPEINRISKIDLIHQSAANAALYQIKQKEETR